MTVSFRFIAALLLLSASSGAESVQEYGETGLQDLQTRSIEDNMVQMEVAEISDDDDDDAEGNCASLDAMMRLPAEQEGAAALFESMCSN